MYSRYLNDHMYSPPSQKHTPPEPPRGSLPPKSLHKPAAPLFSKLQFDTSDLLVLCILFLTMQEEEQNTALLSAVLYFFM